MAIDPCSDLAVVHPSQTPKSATQLTFGDQDHLQAGDEVTVLGYPTSLTADFTKTKLAITTGLVQATGVSAQPGADLPEYPDTVQHSATVNHGNSGGPLIDHHGTVVGVNTLTAEGAAQGQFYSISIGSVKKKIDALMAGKSENDLGWALEPPDIALGQAAADKLAATKLSGLVVTDVDAGSPADHAGIKRDDLITGIQSTATPDMKNVCDILQSVLPGHTVKVTGMHLGSGKAFEVEFNTPGAH